MSDQLNTRKASDLDNGDVLDASDTPSFNASSSVHIKKKVKREPSIFLFMLNNVLFQQKVNGYYDGSFDDILHGGMSEVDEMISHNVFSDNFWDRIGYSFFENAAWCGLRDLVQMLLKYAGENTIAAIGGDYSPLQLACVGGHVEVVELMLEHGVNPNMIGEDDRGNKVLCLALACMRGKPEIVELLLRNGADPNMLISGDSTPLVQACLDERTEVVELLLQHGAYANLTSAGCDRPLSYACQNGNLEVARQLLDHGADINAVDDRGDTPVIIAVRSDNTACVQLLLEYGADPMIPDRHGLTAFDCALEGSEIAQLITNAQLEPILK